MTRSALAVKQTDPSGIQLGFDGVLDCLSATSAKDACVDQLIEGVRNHASGPLADELTVAAL